MLCLFFMSVAGAKELLLLAAQEHEPYLGINLPNQGYVHQIVTEAFARKDVHVEFVYYPAARAQKLAAEGKVDGILPVYFSDTLSQTFLYSAPFPGDVIGLLKRKDTATSVVIDKNNSVNETLQGLSKYHFGLVRGSASEHLVDQTHFLSKQYVSNNLINIDKLFARRIDFALIDKYSAGHLIVSHRPHMIGKLEFVYPPLVDKEFHIAFTKSNSNAQRWVNLFNQGLASMIADGRFANILARHGFSSSPKEIDKDLQNQKLVIGTVNNADMLILKDLSSHFELDNPDVQLEWKVLGEGVLRKRLLTDLAISAGQFDVMTIGSYEIPIWAKNGWIAPIDSLPEEYGLDDIVDSVKNDVSVDKQLFALPFYAESSVTYYRLDLFKQADIVMPKQPTFNQIYEFANKLNAPEKGIYGICLRGKGGWGSNLAMITTMVNSYGGSWFDLNWRPQIESKEWHNAVSMYVDLLTKFGPPNAVENNYIENLDLFLKGKCAIWVDASIAASSLVNSTQSTFSQNIQMANAPIAKYKNGSNWLWTWSLAIPSSSSNKDAALKFAQWATSAEYIQLVAAKYGWQSIPQGTRKSIYKKPEYLQAAPFAPVVIDTINNIDLYHSTFQPSPYLGVQFVPIAEFTSMGDQVGMLLEKALKKELTVESALKQSQDLVDKQMRISGYY
ncbi:extracellular solute-binding protein [Aliiglaciecola lipolytica]|uniref:extracellular solute-binding protein n=1 Tax=Aliiglaciecola lipolytica TaxID=477689 RepID=UPI00339DA130